MSALFGREEEDAILAEVARAPSVHNIQPARWRFAEREVILFRALDRVLPVADPTGHDVAVSLGASFEGMALALGTRGFRLGGLRPDNAVARGCDVVGRASVDRAALSADPLAAFVATRRSWRGKFDPSLPGDAALIGGLAAADVRVATDLAAMARAHDDATWSFESRPDYHRELWTWLRLSPAHPAYDRDGLNADCLALSTPERVAASVALRPPMFRALAALRLAKPLVSERSQVRSASAVVVFCPRRDEGPFDVGRRFYRLWLEVTALGLHLAPMSASADDPATRAWLERELGVPADRRVANVLRVGRVAPERVAASPRLPLAELRV